MDHALRLITHLAQNAAEQGATATELTVALTLSRPTVYRLLATLQAQGWVKRENKRYRLTLQLLALAESAFSASGLRAICQPHLLRLSRATGETAHFAVLDGGKAGYIAKVEGQHPIRMNSHVGWRGPLHATAVGKVMLAASRPVLEALTTMPLERYTDRTLVDMAALQTEIERTRRQGYAIDDEELLDGLLCVAAAVVTAGKLIGAVSIAGPVSRRSTLLKSVEKVRDTAQSIALACN